MALWCLGFAAVNLAFEITGHFVGGAYAHYASGVSSAVVTVQVRPAYATLGVYAFGSVAAEQRNHLIRCANTKLAKTLDFRTFGAGTGGEERVLLDAMRRRGSGSCPARWNAPACS